MKKKGETLILLLKYACSPKSKIYQREVNIFPKTASLCLYFYFLKKY